MNEILDFSRARPVLSRIAVLTLILRQVVLSPFHGQVAKVDKNYEIAAM